METNENLALLIKKATLRAWTRILLKHEMIDQKKFNHMMNGIDRLKA